MKKQILALVLAGCSLLAACGTATGTPGTADDAPITVISREEGSGTRGAFTELLKITNGNGDDATAETAESTSSTSVMLATVSGNRNAIGYVSLGSLSSDVKAIKVNGVDATVENIRSAAYPIARPFVLCWRDGALSALAQDFCRYIMSKEGQALVDKNGYISVAGTESYTTAGLTGKVTLAGSTSVAPLMEKLADAYKALNPDVTVGITQSGSSAGITSATEGVCDIGMSSRELKDAEKAKLKDETMAMDGIAVIVNKSNTVENLTSDQIRRIYLGELTGWKDI